MRPFDHMTPQAVTLCSRVSNRPMTANEQNQGVFSPKKYFTEQEVNAAKTISDLCCIDPARALALKEAGQALPPEIFTILILSIGARVGFQELEQLLNLPARSAKVLARIGLQDLIRRGIIKA